MKWMITDVLLNFLRLKTTAEKHRELRQGNNAKLLKMRRRKRTVAAR